LESLKGRDHSENQGIDGRIIFKWILRKQGAKEWTGFIWLMIGTGGDCCKHGNEPSGITKYGEFLD
jgi:hypothetical protein